MTPNQGYSSFKGLKKNIGSAGDGNDWHHIVEQSQIKKSGFSPEQIHNTNNIIAVDHTELGMLGKFGEKLRSINEMEIDKCSFLYDE